jgi:hypothetical protein
VSKDWGTDKPSALAVLRLMTSSYFVGALNRKVGRLLALERRAVLNDAKRRKFDVVMAWVTVPPVGTLRRFTF